MSFNKIKKGTIVAGSGLTVTGSSTFSNNIAVSGTTVLSGASTFGSTLSVNGNVGIGTASTSNALEVSQSGTVKLGNALYTQLRTVSGTNFLTLASYVANLSINNLTQSGPTNGVYTYTANSTNYAWIVCNTNPVPANTTLYYIITISSNSNSYVEIKGSNNGVARIYNAQVSSNINSPSVLTLGPYTTAGYVGNVTMGIFSTSGFGIPSAGSSFNLHSIVVTDTLPSSYTDTILNGGNLGIGISNPSTLLQVSGTSILSGATTFGSTLNVTGALTAANTTIGSTLNVAGALTAASTSILTGATTVGSTLTVSNNISQYGSTTLLGGSLGGTTDNTYGMGLRLAYNTTGNRQIAFTDTGYPSALGTSYSYIRIGVGAYVGAPFIDAQTVGMAAATISIGNSAGAILNGPVTGVSTLYYVGAVTTGSTLNVAGAMTAAGTSVFSGASTYNSTLYISGTTTLNSTLNIVSLDNVTVTSTLLNFKNVSGYGIYADSQSISARGNTLDFKSYDFNATGTNITTRSILTMRPEGSIGIGTTAPYSIFHMAKSFTADNDTSSMITFQNTTPAYFDWMIGPQVLSNQALFSIRGGNDSYTALSNMFNIHGSGNVGIGTTTPNYKLDVTGDINFTGNIYKNGTLFSGSGSGSIASDLSVTGNSTFNNPAGDTWQSTVQINNNSSVAGYSLLVGGSGNGTSAAGVGGFAIHGGLSGASDFRLNINSNGNVGIGTTNPSAKLHVEGSLNILGTSTGGSGLVINDIPGARWRIGTGSYALNFFKHSGTTSSDFSSWSQKMILDQNGYLGVGTTSPNTYITVGPNGGVNGSGNIPGISMKSISGSYSHYSVGQDDTHNVFLRWVYNASAASGYGSIQTYSGSNPLCLQDGGGYVGVGTGNPTALFQIASTGQDYTNSFSIKTAWPSIYLDGSNVSGGRNWSIINGGTGAGIGVGNFGIFDVTGSAYRFNINASGNIGINNSSPAYRLDVGGDINFTGNIYKNGTLFSGGGGSSQWTTNGNNVYYTTGNVGVGTTAPNYLLSLSGPNFPNLELNRTGSSTNYGVGTIYTLTSGSFKGNYAYAFGGATTIATSAQSQAYGYYGIDLANAGNFYSDTTGYNTTYFFTDTVKSCFPYTNVGIGTNNPSFKLHVYGNVDGGVEQYNQNASTGTSAYTLIGCRNNTPSQLVMFINSSNRSGDGGPSVATVRNDAGDLRLQAYGAVNGLHIKSTSGNVGIGTTTPTSLLDVSNASADNYIRVRANAGTYSGISLTEAGWYGHTIRYNQNTDALVFSVQDNTPSFTDKMTLTYSGSLGIGTMSPGYTLDVNGTFRANGGSKIIIQNSQDGGTGRGIHYWNEGDTNWGGYMGQSGGGRSLSGGTACTGAYGFSQHAIRNRVANSNTQGFIWENASENCLMSIRADGAGGGVAGSWGVNTLSPGYTLDVNGNCRIASGDNSKTYYGPNSTWGAALYVGAGTYSLAGQTAQVITTNGNLHLDVGTAGRTLYLNYYTTQVYYASSTIESYGTFNHHSGNLSVDNSIYGGQVYTNDWFRVNGGGGLYWQSYGMGIQCSANGSNSYGNIATYATGRNGWSGFGAGSKACFMNSGSEFGLHDNDYSWAVYAYGDSARTVKIGGSVQCSQQWDRFVVFVNGYDYSSGYFFVNQGGGYGMGSDERIKKNIKPIQEEPSIAFIKNIQPCTFCLKQDAGAYKHMTADGKDTNNVSSVCNCEQSGFIAQNVLDSAVKAGIPKSVCNNWYDYEQELGLPDDQRKTILGVSSTPILSHTVNVVKNLLNKMDAREKENQQLVEENNILKQKVADMENKLARLMAWAESQGMA